MDNLIIFLVFCQSAGAFVGAIAAIWAERAYILAMRDGKIDVAEKAHLHSIGIGLRFGMTLILLSSLALIFISYSLHGPVQPAMTVSYWIFITLALLIIVISWALARRNIPSTLGSASAFAAWWLLIYLTLGLLPFSYGAAIGLYLIFSAIMYAVFYYIRLLSLHKRRK